MLYATAEPEDRYRLASTTDTKNRVVERLVEKHRGDQTLVIGQYLDQLDELGRPHRRAGHQGARRRSRSASGCFEAFRHGEEHTLVVSKVANFSVDLPEAAVAIQVSGTFGSRQEEAQRLGRILRPKSDGRGARLLRRGLPRHARPGLRRAPQRFLAEQGYAYRIVDADDILAGEDV
jgi:DNA excision repair protein ERCC-3